MKTAKATLESISPYQQSKHYVTEKLEKESPGDYEIRTWRDRAHVNQDGYVFIPPMQFKKSLEIAASFLSMKIIGKGKATYTKHFLAGVLVTDPIVLPIKKEDMQGIWVFVPSDGKKGGSTRVNKCFPTIHEWKGEVTYYILDETITESIFRTHLEEAGNFIGIGTFRPGKGGYYGRYKLNDLVWN